MEELVVTRIVAANRIYNTESEQPIVNRGRRRWAVALKRTGRTVYTVNGRQVVSDDRHLVLLPRGCRYSWCCLEAGECLLIEFESPETVQEIFSFPVADCTFFENAFLELQKSIHIPTVAARVSCMQLLYGVLAQLYKNTPYVPKAKQLLVQPALDYLAENYFDAGITNDSLAALCGVSTVHFRKSFEAVTGKPPIRYLHDLRIRKAKDILSSDFDSIAQVAQSVGYTSLYHFSKMFKRYTGMSPREYAKR